MLKAFIIWTMGSLGSVTKSQLMVLAPAVGTGVLLAFLKVKDLNAFLLGEDYARSLEMCIRDRFREGKIFNNIKRTIPGGGNDFWESGTVNPHLVLRDLISIFHPSLISEEPVYYLEIK